MAPSRRLSELFFELRARTDGLDRDLKGAERSFGKLTEYVLKNPVKAIAAVGLAATAAAFKLSEMAARFESAMVKVNTVAKLSAAQLGALGKEVQALFTQLPVENVNQLTEGLYQLLSSGVPAAEAMQALDVAGRAAVGGFTDVRTVVDAVTSAMNAYKDENLTAARAADVMAKAVADGKIEFSEISSSIGSVVGIAATFGTSIEEIAAVLTQLSLSGINASEGVTGLRTAMISALKPASEFKTQFPELAKAFDESRLKRDGFIKFLLDFQKESGGSTKALQSLFRETRAYAAVVTLLKDGGDGLAQSLENMSKAAGSVDEAFDKVNESTAAVHQRIKNEINVSLTQLGNPILKIVNAELKGLVGLLDIISGRKATAFAQGPLATVQNLGPLVERLGENSEKGAKTVRDLVIATNDMVNAFRKGDLALKDLDLGGLQRLQTALQALQASERISGTTKRGFAPLLAALDEAIEKAPRAAAAVAKVVSAAGLSPEELEAQRAAAQQAADDAAKAAKKAAEIRQKQLQEELDAVHKALDEQVEARKAANQKIFEAQRESARKLAEMAGDTVGVLKTELSETIEEFKKLGATDSEIERITKPLEVAVTAATALNGALSRIEVPPFIAEMKEKAEEAAEEMEAAERATLKLADAISDIGNALLSVAGALGVIDQRTENIARGAVNIGAGVLSGNALQVTAGVGDLIKGIVSGNEQARQHHKEALERLEAIKKHTGDLAGRAVTGNQLAAARNAATAIAGLDSGGGPGGLARFGLSARAELARLGLSFKDVAATAAELGLTLDGSQQSWRDLKAVLDEIDLKAFTDTFEGMQAAAEASRRIRGTDDPLKQLIDQAQILKRFSPDFVRIFEGLDLESAADRQKALERIIETFDRVLAGGADLGDLELDQFLEGLGISADLIRELVPELDELPPVLTEAMERLHKFQMAVAAFGMEFERLNLGQRFRGLSAGDVLDGLIAAFATSFKDAADSLDFSSLPGFKETAGALIDSFFADGELTDQEREQIAVLEQLLSAYEAAAAATQSFADSLRDAFTDIDFDTAIFGGSAEDALNKKFSTIIAGLPAPPGTGGGTPGGSFDLSTQAGRDEARRALQDLARLDPSLKPLLADLIRDLDSLPDLPGDIADALAERGARGTGTVSAGLQQLTVFQGDRLITLAESQLLRQTQIRDIIASAAGTRSQVLQPPPLSAFSGGAAFVGSGAGTSLTIGSVNVSVTVPDGMSDPKAIGEFTARAINRSLADTAVNDRYLAGSTRVI